MITLINRRRNHSLGRQKVDGNTSNDIADRQIGVERQLGMYGRKGGYNKRIKKNVEELYNYLNK